MVAGPGRNLASRCAAADGAGTRLSEQHARMQIGDDGAGGVDPLAAGEDDAFGRAAFDRDALHRRAEPHLAAGRGNGAHHGGDDDVGAAAPERHAEGLIRHRFQIRKQRAAGAIGRKIEMHAPHRQHGLELFVLEILVEPFARRSEQEPHRLGDPCGAACPPRTRKPRAAPAMTATANRAARRYAARPRRTQPSWLASLAASAGLNAGDPLGVRGGVLFHSEPAAVRECGGETPFRADEIEAVREQAILMRGKKRRAGKQSQIHRVEIVAKAGEGDFCRLDRAAGHLARSTTSTFQPLAARCSAAARPFTPAPITIAS